jgi:hypothetical protein
MLLIGARFRTFAAARAALRAVRESVPVSSGDVAVRPLGSTAYDTPEEVFLLAGRFDPAHAGAVTAIVHSEGGRIIERRADIGRPGAPAAAATPATATAATPATAAAAAPPLTTVSATRLRPSTSRGLRLTSRPTAPIAGARRGHGRAQNRLRRPSPPLRVRTARGHRLD